MFRLSPIWVQVGEIDSEMGTKVKSPVPSHVEASNVG